MKRLIISALVFLSAHFVYAEEALVNRPWVAFWNEGQNLRGFKDAAGNIRIEPKFMGYTVAVRFNHIMAVMEEQHKQLISYYLLKDGRKIGRNNTYITGDMSFDCESEGTIRFRDHTTDKVGFLDDFGNIMIPASYSDASPFRNGVACVLKNAKRVCWNGGEHSNNNNCEHWRWEGGKGYLIDKKNNVLIDNFKNDLQLDWYSMHLTDIPAENPSWVSFRGKNGKYYSFVDVKKDFEDWLHRNLIANLSKETLIANTYAEVTCWEDPRGWVTKDREVFINRNYRALKTELQGIKNLKSDSKAKLITAKNAGPTVKYVTTINGLNPYIYENETYQKYFDDCRNPKTWQYPVLGLVIEHNQKSNAVQNLFDFLKTDDGYRLISVTFRTACLK